MKIDMRINWIVVPLMTVATMLASRLIMMGNWQWYLSLKLPSIMPSVLFISGIWQIIYICTTGCILLLYNLCERTKLFWVLITLFVLSTILMLYWKYLFFNQHLLGWAAVCAATLSATLWTLVILVWQISIFCSLLLLPYAIWISIMVFFNAWIWFIN